MQKNLGIFFNILLQALRIIVQIINVGIILALLTLHFLVKEHNYWTALYFYAIPLPIIILVVLLLSIVLTKKWRKYNLILASILLVVWLSGSFKVHVANDIKETDLEVVFWNASRDNNFEDAFKENGDIPDVLVLVESKKNNIKELQFKYPNYFFYKSGEEIDIFSKTPLTIESEKTSNYNSTIINFETEGINFYAIDVTGSQDVPREWELGFIDSLIEDKEKTILLGDFNVPFESKYLKRIKKHFNHAFSKKGNGFRETWFWNIPLLSLDHIWVSRDLEILKTAKISTFQSDHSMIKTYIKR